MGLHREQSRGKPPWVPLSPRVPFTAVSFPQCHTSTEHCRNSRPSSNPTCVYLCVCFPRCLMEPSSSSPWPPWWPPQWPTAPAAPGMLSVSSSRYESGRSRGSSMVRLGGVGAGCPLCPVLYCQVRKTAVSSLRYPPHSLLRMFVQSVLVFVCLC